MLKDDGLSNSIVKMWLEATIPEGLGTWHIVRYLDA
jgi:hypothetical protein